MWRPSEEEIRKQEAEKNKKIKQELLKKTKKQKKEIKKLENKLKATEDDLVVNSKLEWLLKDYIEKGQEMR